MESPVIENRSRKVSPAIFGIALIMFFLSWISTVTAIVPEATFRWPLGDGLTLPRITQDYACRGKTILKLSNSIDDNCFKDDKYHTGIDMNSQPGINEPVFAAEGGTVCLTQSNDGNDHGLGNTIIIKHRDNVYSLYAHLKDLPDVSGEVEKGAPIGTTGGTGNGIPNKYSTHLHFEIKRSCSLGDKDNLNWGYTKPSPPSVHGYYDPWKFIKDLALPNPVPIKVVNSAGAEVYRGPSKDYSVFTSVNFDQRFVAFAKIGDWYRIYLPCDNTVAATIPANASCSGWITSFTIEDPSATQVEIRDTGISGSSVRKEPGTGSEKFTKVWDTQRFVAFEGPKPGVDAPDNICKTNRWYKIYLPANVGTSAGWVCDEFVTDTIPPGAPINLEVR